ncbi:MAG: MATE family efflux transporter [Clostridiales bacterium]|nr:MATE family efflux transporter [Clostridiales bacterium]
MRRSSTTNMTQGNPTKLLLSFAVPMLIGNIFQPAYSLADSIIVGQFLGSSALAAIGTTGSVTFLFFSICNGIASGSGIVTSQYYGAGDSVQTKRAIANAAYIMFVASLVMSVIAYIAAPWALAAMKTPEDILPDAVVYMRMSCIGVPLVAVYNYSSSMLRALGDSRTPLYFLIFACILNIGLDLLCVNVWGMGVFGAALATIIAQIIAGVGCMLYALKCNPYFQLAREDFTPDWRVIGKSVRLGLPLAMQWSMVALSTSALQAFVNSFGADAMAAFTATNRVENLVHLPYGSISAALATYAGQNYGAGNLHRVKDGLKHGMLISAVFTVVMMTAYQVFSAPIMRMFVKETVVIDIGAQALRLTSWFYIFLALINMCRGILNGIGDALFAFINGVVEVICRIGLPLLVVLIPGVGMWGIWWTAGVTWVISGLSCLMRYFAWRRKVSAKLAA